MKISEFEQTSVVITFLGILLSLTFSLVIFPIIQDPLGLCIDPDKFGDLSRNIFMGKGFIYSDSDKLAVDRGPIYPYTISLLFTIFGGDDIRVVQIFQAVLFGVTGLLVFLLVKTVSDKRSALMAQIVYSLHPFLIWYTSRVWIETTHTFFVTLTAYLLILAYHKLSICRMLSLGSALGLTILTKSTFIIFPLLLLPVFYFKWKKQGILFALVTAMLAYLMILPWTLRNYKATNEFIPVHTSLGLNLIQGNALAENWLKNSLANMPSWFAGDAKIKELLKSTNDTHQSAVGDRKLIKYFINENITRPMFLLWRTFVNSITFWYLSESPPKSIFLICLQLPLVLLFFLGIKREWRVKPALIPLFWLVFHYFLLHSLIIGWARYSVPIIPVMISVVMINYSEYLIKVINLRFRY